jgi:adenylate cyclase
MQVWQRGGQALELYRMARGAMTGAVIGAILTTFDGFVLNAQLSAPLRRAPFAVHVAIKTIVYLGVILFALKLGRDLFPAPGESGSEGGDVLFSLAAAFVFAFVLDVNGLLGQNVLINFVTGRYYAPRLESRVFLLIDMEGSTGFAERLGPLAFHRLVNRFIDDLTQPIVAARGEIHRYVGDELIATWKLEEGIADARCVAACFAAIDQLARRAPDYRREFGAAVTVRAGLHCGPVVTGEMGSVKREIVFLGDTVNTAARIQELCRETGDRVIASADLIDRLELPRGIAKRSLGDLRLRGKGADLALYALTKAAQGAARSGARDGEMAAAEAPAARP